MCVVFFSNIFVHSYVTCVCDITLSFHSISVSFKHKIYKDFIFLESFIKLYQLVHYVASRFFWCPAQTSFYCLRLADVQRLVLVEMVTSLV